MSLLSRKIGHKIMLLVGLVTATTLIGMMAFYTQHEEQSIMIQHDKARRDLLLSMISTLRAVMVSGSAKVAQNLADRLKEIPDIEDFRILRTDGLEAYRDNSVIEAVNLARGKEMFHPRESEDEIRVLPGDHPVLGRIVRDRQIDSFEETADDGRHLLTFLAPITNNRECHRCHDEEQPVLGVIKLTTSLEGVEKSVADARSRSLRILAVSLLLMLSSVYILIQRSVVRPLSEITSAMARVAGGDLSHQVPLFHDFEFKRMASSFNRMLGELLRTHSGFIQERNKLTTIILSAREGIVVTDHQGGIVLANPSAERLLGKNSKQLIEEGFYNLFDSPDHMKALLDNYGVDVPDTIVFNQRVLSLHAAKIEDQNGDLIGSAAMIRDVTEEKKLEESLRHLSNTDKLTGLNNRRRMEELLAVEFDRSRRYGYALTYLLLDVDHFKKFNDTYGHDQGDRVLIALGKVLKEHFRKTDYPCRYGGEEFCVILTSTPNNPQTNGAFIAADRFRQRIEQMVVDDLKVTVSIGLATYPHQAIQSVEDLIKEADKALYEAKHQGRNRVIMAASL